ncbi:MAG: hypothetical protein AB8G23_05610 [Myxococcota bacterium]
MNPKIKNRRMTRWMACLAAVFFSSSLAATAQARLYFDHIPPSACKAKSRPNIEDRIQFNGGAIAVDPSASIWDYDVVVCPISRFRPGNAATQIRISMEGENAQYGWCRLYESPQVETSFSYRSANASGDMIFTSPTESMLDGRVALTAHCLVTPGSSISEISILWDF